MSDRTARRRPTGPRDGAEDDSAGAEAEDANVRVQGEEELDAGGEDFGVRLEPFNLREERKHGTFDKDGFFVRNTNDDDDSDDDDDDGTRRGHKRLSRRQQARARKMALITRDDDGDRGNGDDDDDEDDEWVDDVCRTYSRELRGQSAEAAAAQQRAWEAAQAEERALAAQERRARSDRVLQASMLRTLAGLLAADDETVPDALRRLGRAKRAGAPRAADDLDRLAKVADDLLSLGFADVYSAPRRTVLRLADSAHGVRRERERERDGNEVDEEEAAAAAAAARKRARAGGVEHDAGDAVWEYVLDSEQPPVVHGPYSTAVMAQWRRCGFFVGAFRARVRKVPAGATPEQRSAVPFVPSETVTFE